jgi:hypothetical protein
VLSVSSFEFGPYWSDIEVCNVISSTDEFKHPILFACVVNALPQIDCLGLIDLCSRSSMFR